MSIIQMLLTIKNASSGSTPVGIYYGGSIACSTYTNKVTRINGCMALVGSVTSVGTSRNALAGAAVGGVNGLFYAGQGVGPSYTPLNTVTRINKCGTLVGSETNVGTARYGTNTISGATAQVCTGVFWLSSCYDIMTRINKCGALIGQSSITCYQQRTCSSAAAVGNNAMFYAGQVGCGGCQFNSVNRINKCGVQVGSQTSIGTARYALAGTALNSNGLFYGSYACPSVSKKITRINNCGALVGSETTATHLSLYNAGTTLGTFGYFRGNICNAYVGNTVKINACGAEVAFGSAIGTGAYDQGAAGV
jgi:hypothetical protein